MKIKGKRITIKPIETTEIAQITNWLPGQHKIEDLPKDPHQGQCFLVTVTEPPIALVRHHQLDHKAKLTEIEIFLKDKKAVTLGFVPDILETFTQYIFKTHRIRGHIIRPSSQDKKSLATYERAGFRQTHLPEEQELAQFGPKRYEDGIVMMKSVTHAKR